MNIYILSAKESDLTMLAHMNKRLIEDEGSQNPMTIPELDVLVGNQRGMNFWQKVGFIPYSITMNNPIT